MELLYAANFYQNCDDNDVESRWIEAFEEQKIVARKTVTGG